MADDFLSMLDVRGRITFELLRPPARLSRFDAALLDATDERIVLAHRVNPSRPLWRDGEEVLGAGFWTVWFLFKGQPYDVGRFYRPDGTWTGYYVDVLEPVRWTDSDPRTLHPLVDLFLDLWIAPGGSYEVLDEDELAEAVKAGGVTTLQATEAREVLESLIKATENGTFPPRIVQEFRLAPGHTSKV